MEKLFLGGKPLKAFKMLRSSYHYIDLSVTVYACQERIQYLSI